MWLSERKKVTVLGVWQVDNYAYMCWMNSEFTSSLLTLNMHHNRTVWAVLYLKCFYNSLCFHMFECMHARALAVCANRHIVYKTSCLLCGRSHMCLAELSFITHGTYTCVGLPVNDLISVCTHVVLFGLYTQHNVCVCVSVHTSILPAPVCGGAVTRYRPSPPGDSSRGPLMRPSCSCLQ